MWTFNKMEANFFTCANNVINGDYCLLCPSQIPKELLHQQQQKDIGSTTTSLKVLFKYLGMDVRRLALISGGSCLSEGVVDDGISMRLCDKCSALAKLFEEIHEDFESARLLLTECVSKFMERMKAAGSSKLSSGTDGDHHHLWRAEIVKQWELHLQRAPREELEKLSNDILDSDSSMEKLEEMSFEDQTATEFISSVGVEQSGTTTTSSSSTMIPRNNGPVPNLDGVAVDTGDKPVSMLDVEMDQILKTNHDLIRRLSDVVSRTKFTRQSTPTTPSLISSSTTSTIQEGQVVVSPNVCLICGATSSSPQTKRNHMMMVHTANFFSEHFPPGTTEDEVARVVTNLLQANLAAAGKSRVGCKLCGGVQIAHSMRSHLILKHLQVIITSLTSTKGFEGAPVIENNFPASSSSSSSSESGVERLRIQRLAAKLCGRAKLKCHICGQWCVSQKGLLVHTRLHNNLQTEIMIQKKPSAKIVLYKTVNPSGQKSANSPAFIRDSIPAAARNKRKLLLTCPTCNAILASSHSLHRHMVLCHPLQYWVGAGRLPPSTKPADLNTAIKILEEGHLAGSVKNKVNCRLCSRVCGESSKAFHLLQRHPTQVLATLKSLVEEAK